MKTFFLKIIFLLIIPILILLFVIIKLPPSQALKKSLYYALLDKNKLLKETKNPRIIFIGGSNLSFGLNSQIIKDSLGMNPINTGLNAPAGIKFMLANTEQYIKENDIVVVIPEYQQFYDDYADGDLGLLFTVTDVSPQTIKLLDYKQVVKLSGFLRELLMSKYKNYINRNKVNVNDSISVYDRLSFNKFGDTYIHWNMPKEKIIPFSSLGEKFNSDVIYSLLKFKKYVENKHGKLLISFPCYQDSSFNNARDQIKTIEKNLSATKLNIISSPEKYIMGDSFLFNAPYHLNKKGTDYRTQLLIRDIKRELKENSMAIKWK